jgi:hypothetical protein
MPHILVVRDIADYLAPLSRDVYNLTCLGFKKRLGELFAAEPGLVNARHVPTGCTPLFWPPEAEEAALDMAEFLLDHGADPNFRDSEGTSRLLPTTRRSRPWHVLDPIYPAGGLHDIRR